MKFTNAVVTATAAKLNRINRLIADAPLIPIPSDWQGGEFSLFLKGLDNSFKIAT
jgi:hypothetical protein